jgi:hypothetical protein
MNRRSFSVIVLMLFLGLSAIGQDNREQVYVHLNSQVIVAGESLMLSAYCRSQLTGRPTNLSKVLYVEIIGSSGPIFQEKLKLDGGRGSSEFFVSSTVPTGKYYLVAYTRWMKNFNDYFKSPIEIINPFEPGPATEKQQSKLEVQFFIDNDRPVAGISNSIGFKINSNTKKVSPHKGKIVSSTGETLTSFDHDIYGLGTFEFTPELQESYNMILEDEFGKIHFFEIPNSVESGITMHQLSSNIKLLALRFESAGIKEITGTLRLYNESSKVAEQLVDFNSNARIDLRNIEGELLRLEILDLNDNIIISRILYKPSSVASTDRIKTESSYATRSAVKLGLNLEEGTYSISVRKKDEYLNKIHTQSISNGLMSSIKDSPIDISDYISSPENGDFNAFLFGSSSRDNHSKVDLSILPEFRNEFLDGKILSRTSSPIADEIIALTIFSEPFSIQVSKSDSYGNFSIPYESLAKNTDAIITPVSLDSTYSVMLISPFIADQKNLNYKFHPLDSNQVKEIVDKTIRIQIENAYYKVDTTTLPLPQNPEQIDFDKNYILDEYTRFNSLKETFVEFIPEANVRERRDPKLKPQIPSVPEELKLSPLLLLDGVPVSADKLLDFSASNIERISILNNRYFLGPLISDGVILLKTFEGKMGRFTPSNYHNKTTILGVVESRPFKSPVYDGTNISKLPDQRDQLYWNPNISVEKEDTDELTFYTSDVTGIFEIVVEGFQNNGTPVSIEKTFTVTK